MEFFQQILENPLTKLILDSNIVNFAIAFIAITYFLGKLIPDSSKQRKQELEAEIAAAERTKHEAEEKLIELGREIERSKAESLQIVSSAKDTAETIKEQIIAEAKKEITRLNSNSKKEMEMQKNLVIENIKTQIANLAMEEIEKSISEKQESVDKIIQERLKKDLQKI